ncbi:MAG: LL-diaminopimelate aminotransferase [Paludibacter sp.]|jgi:LL-diaminopimelate aminotransferase|nr:LL-diaminopimelate aminotransferase [Paludibacter sp.]
MALSNENYLKTPRIFSFDEIEKTINVYKLLHPDKKIIRLGIGDVTQPLPATVISALHAAVDEMASEKTFRGYGPPKGYDFLIDKIVKEYRVQGITIDKESVFINDGARADIGNIGHILGRDNIIAIAEPVYPVYEHATIMSGRAGTLSADGKWSNIVYLKCCEENGFIPELPVEKVDIIYICNPNNPTGTTLTHAELKRWVDYALEHESVIIYDGAYYGYIAEKDVPQSIYEIKGAKKVAVELRSYSKLAGFTGLRCGYSVFPPELAAYSQNGKRTSLVELWQKRNSNYTNGVAYIVQRAAEALYTRTGKEETQATIDYYMKNAEIIRQELAEAGVRVWGGINSPYIWFKTPNGTSSAKFFNQLLYEHQIICTPGTLFGQSGEGYMRFTGFSNREGTIEAMKRMKEVTI